MKYYFLFLFFFSWQADTLGRQLSESEAVVVELRCRIAELEKSDKEALARLCKIRELEAEVQASNRRVVSLSLSPAPPPFFPP